jgi:hypothetical protein
MGFAVIGGIWTCIAIHKKFPKPRSRFYQKLRILYYALILIASFGCIGIIFPYTIYWEIHVIGAVICLGSMALGLSIYVYFNVTWMRFSLKIIVQAIIFMVILIPSIPIFLGISQELLQKPVQGMIFLLVIVFPYLHYRQIKKHNLLA